MIPANHHFNNKMIRFIYISSFNFMGYLNAKTKERTFISLLNIEMHLSKRSWKLLWFSLGIYGWMTLKSIRWGIGSSHFYFQRNYLGGRKLELCGKATGWMLDCWFMFRKIKIHLLIRKQILFNYKSKYIDRVKVSLYHF